MKTENDQLPNECYAMNNLSNSLIRIKNGQRGFETIHVGPIMKARMQKAGCNDLNDIANYMNKLNDVSVSQRLAMENGSMWGFNGQNQSKPSYWKNFEPKNQ